MAKYKSPAKSKPTKEKGGWIGPTVLVGAAVLIILIFVVRFASSGPSAQEQEEARAEDVPELVNYPAPDEAFPTRKLRYVAPNEAEDLAREACQWVLVWNHEPDVRASLLIFSEKNGARSAYERGPSADHPQGFGFAAEASDDLGELWFLRGRVLARLESEAAEQTRIEEIARELDMAIVRTFGPEP